MASGSATPAARQSSGWTARACSIEFHDLREDGLTDGQVRQWLASPLSAQLLNRRSTTWRNLPEAQRCESGDSLVGLLLAHPTLIKRPLFERDGELLAIGFKPETLQAAL